MKSIALAFSFGLLVAIFTPYSIGALAHAFAAGALTITIGLLIALSSRKRLKATARLLNSIADFGRVESKNAPSDRTTTPRAPGTTTNPAELLVIDPQFEELTSALLNLGTRKNAARTAVTQAIVLHPAANFETRFRTAVKLLQN